MKKCKNAQITIIILLALVILLMVVLFFYTINNYSKNAGPTELVFDKASIESYINNCVKKTSEEGLILLGRQGGFIILNDYLNAPNFGVSYLYNNGNKVPTLEKMQDELSYYLNNNLNICLNDLNDFRQQGWGIEKGSVNAKTQININDVSFDVDFPLKVAKDDQSISFERFTSVSSVRLNYIYGLATAIVESNIVNPRSADRTMLSNYDLNVTVFPYQNDIVYVIDDQKSLINNKPYRFMFALKFE